MQVTIVYSDICSIPNKSRRNFERYFRKLTVKLLKQCLMKHKDFYTDTFNLYKIEFYIILSIVDKLVVLRRTNAGFRVCLDKTISVNGYSLYNIVKLIEYGSQVTGTPKRYFRDIFDFLQNNVQEISLRFIGASARRIGGYNERIFVR